MTSRYHDLFAEQVAAKLAELGKSVVSYDLELKVEGYYNTLMEFRTPTEKILVRIRKRPKNESRQAWRDWMVRSESPRDLGPTELQLILDGYGDHFFFGWADRGGHAVVSWIFINLATVRSSGAWRSNRELANPSDGSKCVYVSFEVLERMACIEATSWGTQARMF